jgi:hypothetical protein
MSIFLRDNSITSVVFFHRCVAGLCCTQYYCTLVMPYNVLYVYSCPISLYCFLYVFFVSLCRLHAAVGFARKMKNIIIIIIIIIIINTQLYYAKLKKIHQFLDDSKQVTS